MVSNLYLLLVVLLGWVIFRYSNVALGWMLIRSLFGTNGNALTSFDANIQLQSNLFLLAAAILASTPLMQTLRRRTEAFARSHGSLGMVWDVTFYSLIPVVLLLLSTACLVGDSYNPFIYFQF